MWDTLLQIKEPANDLIYPRAILHYAKGMALAGKINVAQAENELTQLKALAKEPVLKEITIWDINTTYVIVQIAVNVLSREIHLPESLKRELLTRLSCIFAKEVSLHEHL